MVIRIEFLVRELKQGATDWASMGLDENESPDDFVITERTRPVDAIYGWDRLKDGQTCIYMNDGETFIDHRDYDEVNEIILKQEGFIFEEEEEEEGQEEDLTI